RDRAHFESRICRQLFTARNRTCPQTARPIDQKDGQGSDTFSMFRGQMYFLFTETADGFRSGG
ncbi:hypothetical protein, partial [Serratia marcescens]|uniref:hypothetical protein n=1 Tax=Serratia marcescens TaxID=615 RepID=UPI0019534772